MGGKYFRVSINCVISAKRAVVPTVIRSVIEPGPYQNVLKQTSTIKAVGMYTPANLLEMSRESINVTTSSVNLSMNFLTSKILKSRFKILNS